LFFRRLLPEPQHETRELFPVIERVLAAEDERLVSAFDRIEEEQIGAGAHERLHRMIEALPARLAPWVKAPIPGVAYAQNVCERCAHSTSPNSLPSRQAAEGGRPIRFR